MPAQNMQKTIIILGTAAACLLGSSAHAEHRQDCESIEYARQYGVTLEAGLKSNVERLREQQARYHKTLDGMLADMQQGGVWSDEDAGRFFQTVWTDAEGKAVDTQRQKAGERYKVQAMAAQAWNGQRGQSPEMLRGMCLLGPRLLEDGAALYEALEYSWAYLQTKLESVAKASKVSKP